MSWRRLSSIVLVCLTVLVAVTPIPDASGKRRRSCTTPPTRGDRRAANQNFSEDPDAISWGPSISDTGRYIAFASEAQNLINDDPGLDENVYADIFVTDTIAGTNSLISVQPDGLEADSHSDSPAISSNGRFVTYTSYATNLVESDTNDTYDVFLYDQMLGTTTLVSSDVSGNEGNDQSVFSSVSEDGQYVVFESMATNLVSGDTNDEADIFVKDTLPER